MATGLTRYNLGLFNSGTYSPFVCNISAVSTGATTTVTTSIKHGFVVGNEVTFLIPRGWGIPQLNDLSGYVSSVPTTSQIIVGINSTFFDPFVTPSPPAHVVIDYPQVAGVGDCNFGNIAVGGVLGLPVPNVPPGSFENQPP